MQVHIFPPFTFFFRIHTRLLGSTHGMYRDEMNTPTRYQVIAVYCAQWFTWRLCIPSIPPWRGARLLIEMGKCVMTKWQMSTLGRCDVGSKLVYCPIGL